MFLIMEWLYADMIIDIDMYADMVIIDIGIDMDIDMDIDTDMVIDINLNLDINKTQTSEEMRKADIKSGISLQFGLT